MLINKLKKLGLLSSSYMEIFWKTTLPLSKGGVETTQLTFTCSQSTTKTLKKRCEMFKVNNKNIRTNLTFAFFCALFLTSGIVSESLVTSQLEWASCLSSWGPVGTLSHLVDTTSFKALKIAKIRQVSFN